MEQPRDPVTGKRRQLVRHVEGGIKKAEAEHARLLVQAGSGRLAGHDATLSHMIEAWMEVATHLSVTSRRDYRSAIDRHIPKGFGSAKLWRIQARDLDGLYAHLSARGVSPARIRRVHNILSAAFAQAVKWEWVARNPAVDASPPPVPRRRPSPPGVDDVRDLLAAADGELLTWLRLDAGLGARRGEVCGLRWGHVDLEAGSVVVYENVVDGGPSVGIVSKGTKTGDERPVALDPFTVRALREHRRSCAERALACGAALGDDSYVFTIDPAGERPWRPDSVTHRFIDLRRRVARARAVERGVDADELDAASKELDWIKLKDLRHFVATQMLAAGVDVKTVSGRLGHARTSTTLDIYAGFVPARDREAADALGRLLG